ncbi:MAG: prolipoprotein diacylglyceryl transferase [Desulfobacterales bacterium]
MMVIPYPNIDPTIIEIGPVSIRWYGVMYAAGFLAAYYLVKTQEKAKRLGLEGPLLQDLFLHLVIGLIAGARFGYILFYQFGNLAEYARHPLEIIAVWHGGMSFHGGLAGAVIAGFFFCRRRGLPALNTGDTVIVAAPIGLGLGRIGNFINGELWGRPTSVPWAMVFPEAGPIPRHPSQLYEAFLEGLVLFILLWRLKDYSMKPGAMVCFFLGGYGIFRFIAEFFRQPDPQIGLLFNLFTIGQVFSVLMIIAAAILWRFLPSDDSG